ncbi:MAG: hypothetical protein LAO24_10015 [Acidobacteriia bacterium]|nr:hypothetical protein [Terriglobia bacterium]
MKTHGQNWARVLLLASFAFLLQASTTAKAQDNDDDRDPPGRVARLNYSQGSVSYRPGGEDDWVTAVPNRPMVSGDDLWTDEDSRAEVHVGSTAIRLGSKTGITFLALDDQATQIRLAQGSMILRVRHVDDDDTYEVDTPNLAFTLLQPGEYRVDVSADGNQTIATVWHGRGRATGGGFSYTVVARQSATFTGTDHLDYDLGQIPEQDNLDRWAFERDDHEDHADSANYVSREMTGYEDLDEYGDWSYVAGYGPCWRPRAVVVGWAPYRFGHWVWVGPWGWTWVEDEPWGFAPFHYGRWAFVSGGWFWVPGPVVVRPVWAPALVAFVGGGPGVRFSAGVGVGWFPLAPGEVFVPGYRVSRTYVNNVNITNTTVNITNVTNVYNTVVVNRSTGVSNIRYANMRVNGGVTVVSHDAFVNARPVARNVLRVEPREIEAAQVSHRVEVEPVRASVIGAGRPAPAKPPAAIINRQVVAQRTPPPAPRSFEQRQVQAGGRLNQQPLVRPEPQPARPGQPNQGGQQSQEGFRPFGPPSGGNPPARQQPRVWEQQGTPQQETRGTQAQPENRGAQPQPGNRNVGQPDDRRTQPEMRSAQPENQNQPPENRNPQTFRPPPQREEVKQSPQETRPLVRPAPPVEERNQQHEQQQEQKFHDWQQKRPATPPPQPPAQRQQTSRAPEPKQDKQPSKPDKH